MFTPRASRDPLPGYIADTGKIEEEYLTLTGKPLDPAAEGQFDRATESMRQGNYGNAAIVLEAAARDIPVPAVFNDLGVLYAKLKDGRRAIRAFRDALARDHDSAPTSKT
jgi:Tfp pilus assembly protein PilF